MSDHFARSAISRMNLRELLISAHYEALAADIRMLAAVDQSAMELETHRRQDELMSAYGFTPVSNAERKPFAFANGVAVIEHGRLSEGFAAIGRANVVNARHLVRAGQPGNQNVVIQSGNGWSLHGASPKLPPVGVNGLRV